MKTRIMYIESKETGEARIGRVSFSRTLQTVYYQAKTLHRGGSEKIKGNFFDAETHEEYWVSGPKKRGGDAHYAQGATITIDEDVKGRVLGNYSCTSGKKIEPACFFVHKNGRLTEQSFSNSAGLARVYKSRVNLCLTNPSLSSTRSINRVASGKTFKTRTWQTPRCS